MEKAIDELMRILDSLRGEGGCPWDRKQTFDSLRPFIIEEAYEVAEAIDKRDWNELKEELGDLLFLILFFTHIAQEKGLFDLEEMAKGTAQKIIRRHPHVFGNLKVRDSQEVESNWHRIKEQEKGSLLSGIPRALPALLRAQKITRRAQSVGFDWEEPKGALEKIEEELQELKEAFEKGENLEHEIGDLILSIVNFGRLVGIQAEEALHKACDRFIERFSYIEKKLKEQGKHLGEASLNEMDRLWNEAKGK
jgi:tetrapyrrole methylase family protein/MazG family protein